MEFLKKIFNEELNSNGEIDIAGYTFQRDEVLNTMDGEAYKQAFLDWKEERKNNLLAKADEILSKYSNASRFRTLQNKFKESKFKNKDKAAVISSEARSGKSKICIDVMDIFVTALGRQAGNMVMNFKTTGGVYLGGSIPIKNISLLKKEGFNKSFLNKGRLSYLTEMTPVYVISDKTSSLKGAAYFSHMNREL